MSGSDQRRGVIKRFLPNTLFGRSLLILVTPVLLIQFVTTFMFFDRHWGKVTSRLAYAVAGEVAVMADLYEGGGGDTSSAMRMAELAKRHLEYDVRFYPGLELSEAHDRESAFAWESHVAQTLRRELRGQLQRPFVVDVDFQEKWIEVDVQLINGLLRMSLPQRRMYSSSGRIFLLWVFGSSFVLLAVAVVFMRNQIRPIRKLAAAAKRFGKGRDVSSFRPQGAREVREAGEAFIDMHRRIKRQVSQRTAMLAGVSHDLRTPLTRMKLQLAMIDGEDARSMQQDISDMERMINGYLDFVRGEGDEASTLVGLDGLVQKVLDSLNHFECAVHTDIAADIQLRLRPHAFQRCLSNILTNAAKYGDEIWLAAFVDEAKKLVMTVDDNGPGLDAAQFDAVFKPFFRGDESRNADTGGVGLGLSIAMDVVHAHGGKIWLEKSPRGGLRVVIRMPV
ncbi:MAG: ATP-binding protein [Bdellovibrionales bacterium]